MPRIKPSARGGSISRYRELPSIGFHVPGLYARLLEYAREHERTPDPRWKYTEAGKRGEPCPDKYLWKSRSGRSTVEAMEAGKPTQLPGWTVHVGDPGFPDLGPGIPT